MKYVNTHEAKSQLSKLIAAVRDGEEVVICQAGKPVARLMAFEPASGKSRSLASGRARSSSSQVGIRRKPTPRSQRCSTSIKESDDALRLLIDSHRLPLDPLQSAANYRRMRDRAIGDPANERFVSIASLWEIAIKLSVGKLSIAR